MNEEKTIDEPKTEWVAPRNTFIPQDHEWLQTNAVEITCSSCKFKHGSHIPMGKTLIGTKGDWSLIDTPISR